MTTYQFEKSLVKLQRIVTAICIFPHVALYKTIKLSV